jgi:hypothetical protein
VYEGGLKEGVLIVAYAHQSAQQLLDSLKAITFAREREG